MKINLKNTLLGILISLVAFVFVYMLFQLGHLEGLESKSLDLRFNIRGPRVGSREVIIVAIDEESVHDRHFGRWPWDRDVHGNIVRALTAAGARVVSFDVLFSEPDRVNKLGDRHLEEEIKKSGRVVLSFFGFLDNEAEIKSFKTKTYPLKSFIEGKNSAAYGFTNVYPELDGVCRKVSSFISDFDKESIKYFNETGGIAEGRVTYDEANEMLVYYPLSVATVAKFKGLSCLDVANSIPMDDYGEMIINFAGGYQNFLYVPFYQVLEKKIKIPYELKNLLDSSKELAVTVEGDKRYIVLKPEELFKDKIVLVGSTAAGLYDKHPIPFSPAFPGVEIHANAIGNMLENNFIIPPKIFTGIIFMALFAVLLGIILPNLSPGMSTAFFAAVFAVWAVIVQFIFSRYNTWIYFIPPFFTILISYVGILIFKLMTEEKEKKKIKKTFSHYLSPKIMEEVLSDPKKLKLGGRKEIITVLFSDIRGFTSISEACTPEEIVALLNEYLTKMTETVFSYQGTLDKFIGDAVMAFWNAPVPQNNHAELALGCAIKMMEELAVLRKGWQERGLKHMFDIGVGLNTGQMVVGNMGSAMKMDYTLIGDQVNLGSRLEGLNKQYHTHIIISESTFNMIDKEKIEYRLLGEATVKGKEKGVKIYGVFGRKENPFEQPPEIEVTSRKFDSK